MVYLHPKTPAVVGTTDRPAVCGHSTPCTGVFRGLHVRACVAARVPHRAAVAGACRAGRLREVAFEDVLVWKKFGLRERPQSAIGVDPAWHFCRHASQTFDEDFRRAMTII